MPQSSVPRVGKRTRVPELGEMRAPGQGTEGARVPELGTEGSRVPEAGTSVSEELAAAAVPGTEQEPDLAEAGQGAAPDGTALDGTGLDGTGLDGTGQRAGLDGIGPRPGPDGAGPDSSGPDGTVLDGAGPDDSEQNGSGPDTGRRRPGRRPGQRRSPGSGRDRARRALVRQPQNLLALLLYGGLSLALFGPWILSRMSTSFLSGQPQDGSLFIWSFVWWPFAISHHLSAIFSSFAWAPGGINLAWATTVPGPAIALQALTKDYGPFFTFNVIELAAPALAAWTAYLLCRRIVGSFAPALIGGFFFGFSPALIDEIGQGHPSLTLVFLVPLCAYLVVRLLEGSIHPLWYVQLLGIVLAAQLYIGEEIFATMTLVGGICALVGFGMGPAGRRRRLLRAIAPTAGAYVVAAVLASPLLYTMFTRTPIVKAIHFATIGYGAKSGNDFLRYVTPGRYTNHWGLFVLRWGDNPWYLGIPLIVVVILFAVTERRRRITWALFAGLVLILALSLGDLISVFGAQIMPWRLIAALPVLNVAQPGRLLTYFYLLIAVLVARWLTRRPRPAPVPSPYPPSSPLWRPTPRPPRTLYPLRWLIVILAGVTILPAFSTDVWAQNVPEPPFLASGAYRHALSPGETVWVVDSHADRQLVWQAETHFYFRLAGGFFGGTPRGVPNAPLQERFAIGQIDAIASIADIRNFLAAHRVGAVLVADAPWPTVLAMRTATGHWGYHVLGMRLFRLGDRFTNPALAHQPIRRIGSNRLVHERARRAARHVQPVHRAQVAHRAPAAHRARVKHRARAGHHR
jgi:hypothetical protein